MRPRAARRAGRALRAARWRRFWLGSGRQRPMSMGDGLSAKCTRRWRSSERGRASRHGVANQLKGSDVTAAGRPGRIRPRRRRGCHRLAELWVGPGCPSRPHPDSDRAGDVCAHDRRTAVTRPAGLLHRQRDRGGPAAADERGDGSPVPAARVAEISRSRRVSSSVSASLSRAIVVLDDRRHRLPARNHGWAVLSVVELCGLHRDSTRFYWLCRKFLWTGGRAPTQALTQ
jgi:hypothetical protein